MRSMIYAIYHYFITKFLRCKYFLPIEKSFLSLNKPKIDPKYLNDNKNVNFNLFLNKVMCYYMTNPQYFQY